MEISIENISKKFKQKKAVVDFSLKIQANECVALIGPNGAGKTTLLKIIVGILEASEGTIYLNDQKSATQKKKIGYLPQTPQFFQWMTAEETLFFMGSLSNMSAIELDREIPLVLKKVGLHDSGKIKISQFSGGMKQRLGIAQAILHKPSFLVMDEPVSALDPIGRREVIAILNEIKKDTAIIFSTHILNDASEICDRFCLIKKGHKVLDTTLEELYDANSKNQFVVKYKGDGSRWLEYVRQLSFVIEVSEKKQEAIISVTDSAQNKIKILSSVVEVNLDVISFEVRQESIEDIFFKEVLAE
ncbi:ABC transporter ATP-binding protein [Carnobacterium sp.]|uniref:ABC transporter ATP-binding protein n=1 Tax=Carnobacterium sp. TaxID=48221 RepID=UPI002FC735BB